MIDTTVIRAEWEPRKRSAIYGVEFENGDAATVLAMCDEIDALRARDENAQVALAYAVALHATDWQRAEDALVAAGVEMVENGDQLTIEDGIARLAAERDALRERMEPEYRAMAQEIETLRAKLSGGASNA